ncbi:hypothetical protein PAENIP36_40730 [Paenibacillus sp. P36]
MSYLIYMKRQPVQVDWLPFFPPDYQRWLWNSCIYSVYKAILFYTKVINHIEDYRRNYDGKNDLS